MNRLSAADLVTFDPGGRGGRFCCPFCHGERAMRPEHRSVSVALGSGLYFCHRCEAKGILREPGDDRREHDRLPAKARPARAKTTAPPEPKRYDFDAEVAKARPIAETISAEYLQARGIPADVAHTCGVRFAGSFLGRPAVLFPLRDGGGRLVAVQGRIARRGDAWKRTIQRGIGGHGGVFVSAGAFDAEAAVIAEAPLDALSLTVCGIPAIGLVGVRQCPAWLMRRLAFRRVYLAFDADEAGDREADALGRRLSAEFGVRASRLRPSGGPKDWNEALQTVGPDALRAALTRCVSAPGKGAPALERGRA